MATTPKMRAATQTSAEQALVLAARFGAVEQTVCKRRDRDTVHERSHTPHRLQTTLTPAQEAVAVVLRRTLLVPLDDLLAVVGGFVNPEVPRFGLDRCLRRHGVGNLRDLHPQVPTDNGKKFTDRLFGLRKRAATGKHEFDQLCADLGIDHPLAPPQHSQTNGIPLGDALASPAGQRVKRCNGRIEQVLQSHHFRSGEELETTLHR